MKKKTLVVLFSLFLSLITSLYASGADISWQQSKSVAVTGGKKAVNAVYIDLNDKTIRIDSVLAKNQVGQADEMKNILQQINSKDCQVIAAINGSYFNAYDTTDHQPTGVLETRGNFVHLGYMGSVIGFTGDNTAAVENLYVSVKGSINGSYDYPNNWEAWSINHTRLKGVNILFTPAFGKTTGKHSGTSIVVNNGTVVNICNGQAPIFPGGFTIVSNSSDTVKRFKLGDKADYKLEFNRIDFVKGGVKGPAVTWDNIRTTVGAGPMLVRNGKLIANGKAEGFNEAKINTSRTLRSFIGVTKNNVLIIGTVSNATIKELAEAALKMGVVDGINLDGGASSGLYYKGKYITPPGRKLSNLIVVTKLKERPVRLFLNGHELFYGNDPYLSNGDTVMVPLDNLFKTFGGTLESSSGDIRYKRYDQTFIFKVGSSKLMTNRGEVDLKAPVVNLKGVIYAPLDQVIELWGGKVQWDPNSRIASVLSDSVDTSGLFEQAQKAASAGATDKAVNLYLKVVALDSRHAGALFNLAKYYAGIKDYDKAAEYYKDYIEIYPNDVDAISRLGWVYYSKGDLTGAETVFKNWTVLQPASAASWMALATIYIDYSLKRYAEAESCYKKALELKPTSQQLAIINSKLDYLNRLKK